MYNVIYADPPWEQKGGRKLSGYKMDGDKQLWVPVDNKSLDLPYPTMSIDEIAAIPVKSIVAKDAHLFMCVTNKYLLESKAVIKAWGFKYVTCITWKKKKMGGGLGGMVRGTSEFLLFCRRGNLKATGIIPESVIEAKRPYVNGYPCHSKKPEVFAELIEQVSPGKRLEMFARNQRAGWDVFGNQVENSITFLTAPAPDTR